MTRIWQVRGGPAKRSYAATFLRYGVALLGAGDAGLWDRSRPDSDYSPWPVRRFATKPQLGEIVLLRIGQTAIRAVGLIASDYCYLPQFDDVNGWDLQHARRVRWCKLPEDYDFAQPV